MTVSMRRYFPTRFVPVLIGTVLIAGCSRLPWSKSREKEEGLPEGRTVYIEDLEESKGSNTPPKTDKRPQKSPATEEKRQAPPETKTGEGEKGETIALAPTAPPDLTFSPVKGLTGLKRKICILDFEDRTGLQTEKYGELATLRLLKELERRQQAVLLDREVVWEALAREGIEPKGLSDPPAMKRAHQLMGIQAFVTSSISDLHVTSSPPVGESGIKSSMASARIELRLIDASTGNLLRTFVEKNPSFTSVATGLYSDHQSILRAIDYDLARVVDGMLRYLDFLEWSSTVAKVEDAKVYIHAGRLTGLRVGAVLDVYEPGEEIINPITKFSLGWTTGEQKGKVMVTHLFGVDASIAKPLNGAGFRANDIVKIPQQ
jgi:hypothetical protein